MTTTARQEAAKAMEDTSWTTTYYTQMLDAIPGDVLVRYAIERGALELDEPLYDHDLNPLMGRYRMTENLSTSPDHPDSSQMRCPRCDSHNVECESNREHHEHRCLDCGLTHTWAPVAS